VLRKLHALVRNFFHRRRDESLLDEELQPSVPISFPCWAPTWHWAAISCPKKTTPSVPVDHIATMQQLVSGSVAQSRFRTVVLAIFAALALFVASIGLYGVMSYWVTQRTREFGIRMAVGASRGALLSLVLRESARLVSIGILAGLVGAALLARWIGSLLYGVTPFDVATRVGVCLLLTVVALAASYIPAWRAAQSNPLESLRHE